MLIYFKIASFFFFLPIRFTGQERLLFIAVMLVKSKLQKGMAFYHSCLHFFGLHLSALTMAIRVSLSLIWKNGGGFVYEV
jgi:hypothetical protein